MVESYFPQFRTAFNLGGARALMSSYNAVNGVPVTGSKLLLDGARESLGMGAGNFDSGAFVISDCDAVAGLYQRPPGGHGYVANATAAAVLAITAGCDVDCGDTFMANSNRSNAPLVDALRAVWFHAK
jgi:beta-glucosidase-like glycosyl hydrolase